MNDPITKFHTTLKGVVKEWQVLNSDGTVARQGGGGDNLILDQGMDMPPNNYFSQVTDFCAVGTGTTAPSQSDTGLVNEQARTGNTFSNNTGTFDQQGDTLGTNSAITALEYRRTFEFPVGALDSSTDGDYGELGFSPNNASGNNLFSRTLFRDQSNNPTTVTISSDQSLRVTYSLTLTPGPASQTSSTASITNVGTVGFTHSIQTLHNGSSTNPNYTAYHIMDAGTSSDVPVLEPSVTSNWTNDPYGSARLTDTEYTFSVPGETSTPPSATSPSSVQVISYSSGDHFVDKDFIWDPQQYSGTVTTIFFEINGNVAYALVIDSADRFTKADTHSLTLTFRFSWARA